MSSGKLTRKTSSVIGSKSPKILSDTLTNIGCRVNAQTPTEDGVEIEFAAAGGSSDLPRILSDLMKSLVNEACGSTKGVIKRPEGDIVLDATAPVQLVQFTDVTKRVQFNFDDLPDDGGVAAIGEMTYVRCLEKFPKSEAFIVGGFPRCLSLPSGCDRADYAIAGVVLLSLRLTASKSIVRLYTRSLDLMMGRMCSTNFVESVLPSRWKQVTTQAPDVSVVMDMLEEVQLAINDYWTGSKMDDRAKATASFLMNAVGSDIRAYCAAKCPKGAFRSSKKSVEFAQTLTEDWIGMCERMTTIDWGADWGPTRFSDPAMSRLRQRLAKAVEIRTLHEEVVELLNTSDMRALRGENLWEVFDGVDIFDASLAAETRWETALQTFYRRLEPLEHTCAIALRDFFASRVNLAPQAILGEFVQFKQLVKRPIVAKELLSERDGLLAKLSERMQSIKLEFEHRASAIESEEQVVEDRRTQTGRHMPGIVNKVVWVRQLRGRVVQMHDMVKSMLGDLARADDFIKQSDSLVQALDEYEVETFNNWTFDIQDRKHTLRLDASAPLMNIDAAGKVEVNYSERLVELLREVRIFTAMGFQVPPEIVQIANNGLKFYDKGVAIKSVATTYNSMNTDIIKSTQAMLLDSALTFEGVISGKEGGRKLAWSNTTDADIFITKLRKAAALLTDDNRRLHRLHSEITALVVELFKIDLLRSKDRWMGRIRQIREKMDSSNFANMDAWKLFWDMQIYKALEHQYQLGLESLHEVISEIRADVVFDTKTGRAALRPPIEALRETYYLKIKDFMTFPNRFRGVGNNDFFSKMPGYNERGINAVMMHASNLFRRIEKIVKKFAPLVVLGRCGQNGNPTLEEIVEASLTEVQHWEANIRLLKQKGKEINAVEPFIKVDCVTLRTAGIKGSVEEHLSKLAQILNSTLKKSAQGHLNKITKFLDDAAATLDAKVTKLDEIARANAEHAKLQKQRPALEVEFHHFYNKNRLLQSLTNSPGIDFGATKDRWDQFVARLDAHDKEMEDQLEAMKAEVTGHMQAFMKELERFANLWHELKPKDTKAQNGPKIVAEKKEQFQVLKKRGDELVDQCHYFQLDEPNMELVKDLEEDIESFAQMWALMGAFNDELQTLEDEAWITFRSKTYRFEDFIKAWQDKLQGIAGNNIVLHIRSTLDEWMRVVPILKFVRGEGMTPNHWKEMFRLLNIAPGTTQDSLRFRQVLERYKEIIAREKDLKTLHARAQGEAQIREALDDVRAWAQEAAFTFVPHSDRKGVMLITEWKDLITAVNDNQALLFSMKDSPFFGPFAEDANKWDARLAAVDDYLHHMNAIQRKWVYLEPIFARGALPHEQERFLKVDREYLQIMKQTEIEKKVILLANHADYKDRLRHVLEQLDRCQKALNEFLENKRDIFPRFYFISDDDLLEVLGQSKNPVVIQSHLKKLFMGIHSVRFDANKKHIVEILSLEGESVPLENKVAITDEVEDWLNALDKEMKSTLQHHLVACVSKLDVAAYASQILCLCEQTMFTRKTEEAMRNNSLKAHKANLTTQLRDLTAFSASNTDTVMELKLKALIMDLIHNIEVVDLLIKKEISKETDWLWRKQLRFYLGRDSLCSSKMVDAHFKYSYEYQGNAPKLVHTPLTDKCYLTLTQGMHLGYGGNPYGPAGTGKTESVKALGNAMGRQVLVFNCDEGIDFKSMGRIFTGLVKCGAWGCFDEFNRLKVDQLSAVSQMIQVIQEALKNGEQQCHLLGRNITVNENAGIFVTLNPAGKGYGGRSKLPDNLKQLFRSVAMSAPDNELIAETILFSEGFENATELAKKMVEIFKLSRQLLSQQQHYDWGLRAMKAVLRLGGTLVHAYLKEKANSGRVATPEEVLQVESEIIIKSLRVNTLSKLTFKDVVLFNNLISDVFPGIAIRQIQYQELRPAIVKAIEELKLQVIESQIEKILQLYEAMNQRMGVVLVGPSGSGKSTLLKILRKAMIALGTPVPLYVMNPKAMPRNQLLGHMDMDTREWFDGVLTEAAKKVVKEDSKTRSWIFCDGDIDPEWVESLNSVLDDNKLLTMPNGVRIQFGSNVNFVFETHTLQYASPATVSRMGMIFLSEEDVDPKMAVASWLAEQPAEIRGNLGKWIADYFLAAIDALLATKALVVETTKMGLVMAGLSQLGGCQSKSQFAIALIQGLGSFLSEANRVDFARDVFHMTSERPPDAKRPLDCGYSGDRGGLYQFQYEASLDMTVDDLKSFPMVRTIDVQRNLATMEAWTRHGSFRPFILVGPEGCGKTMLLQNCFANLNGVRVAVVNCSAQTVAAHVIQKLKQMCQVFNTNQGRVLRPKEADRLILLLKDLNLPKPDKYGTVQLHSFLQQLILYQGFYDADLEWVTVERLQIVGSMNPPGSMGRFPVAPRFIAIVSVLTISYPTKESLQTVYADLLTVLLQSPQFQSVSLGSKSSADVARAITEVYEKVTKKYSVDDASHYIFNPRDLTNWVLNSMNYNVESTPFIDVIAYEGQRIFADRLVKNDERAKLEKLIADSLSHLGHTKKEDSDKERSHFLSWLDASPQGVPKRLQLVKGDDIKKQAQLALTAYARDNVDLEIQLIPEVLAWLARVDRVLSKENGNLLLVGRAGVCSGEVVRLAAFQLKMELFQLNMTRDYSVKNFSLEVKAAIQKAGVEGAHTVLLLEDHNFSNPTFLEMINSLLSSGEIPGLYTQEEVDALLGPLKEEALSEGFSEGVYSYFVHRVRRFLHVCVIMDPTNSDYELRCRSNPALFTRCNLGWVGTWTSDSMKLVPRLMLRDVFRALDQRDDKKDFSLTNELVHLHKNMGERFAPAHFKTLCRTYEKIFNDKSNSSGENLKRLQIGLAKLAEAEQNVDTIQQEVTTKKAEMEIKQKEADEALVEIQKKMGDAGEQKKNIEKIKKDIDAEQSVIEGKKSVIEKQLSGIQPILDAAREAVGQIKSEHLSELKSMKTPPAAVQDVLEGVLIIQGKTDTTWAGIRKYLAGDGVKSAIMNFDTASITQSIRDNVEKHLAAKANSFKPDVISRSSKAAAPMAEWLKANIEYSKVLESIQPMTEELRRYEENLSKGKEKMAKYEEKLQKVEKKVDELKKNFGQKTKEAERLKDKLEQAEATLRTAEELLGKLAGEKTRWSAQVKSIQQDMALVPRKTLLAAGFITYLGREPEDVRRRVVEEWREKVKIPEFNFFTFLRSESTMLQYKAEGLPGDELSMDNALMILEQANCAMIVDPASQATDWLRNHLKSRDVPVEVCSISDERMANTLELCVRFGKTLLLCEVDRIEPLLYPLIRRELRTEGPKKVVQIGDKKSVDFAESFQLVLLTRSTDLKLPPDAECHLTEISFTITHSGLEGQLLGVTIQHEQPELEQQKIEILRNEEALKVQLAGLEESLLKQLSESKGSLLEDTKLIESLNQIKTQATSIAESLSKSKDVQVELDAKRNAYRPFATTGSIIFFLIKDLRSLNHMYQFSLSMFLKLFNRTLRSMAGEQLNTQDKIEKLSIKLGESVVASVSRALFKEHRTAFGIHLASALNKDSIGAKEWQFFTDRIVAETALAGGASSAPSVPSWVLPESKQAFQLFAASFTELLPSMNLHESDVWYQWIRSATPEAEIPPFVRAKLSPFQQLLIIKTLRADRLIAAMNAWASKLLHVSSLSDSSTLKDIAALTTETEPVLLITTPGADPSQELQTLAYEVVGRHRFFQVAMGGGQTDEGLRLLRECATKGDWLFLKNLHLVIPWVVVLEKELNLLTPHKDFRLWLTSESHDEFPSILLSTSLKVTFEAPPGVKQNLVRTYNSWTPQYYNAKSPVQTQLLFALAWLHATVQERRSYIPQGWAKFYEFSAADIKSASDVIVQQSGGEVVDWKSIHGILENAVYGGQMETEYDVRILRTYLLHFFNNDVLSSAGKKQLSLSRGISIPSSSRHEDFVKLIDGLAESDVPALFSLPSNADRVVQRTRVTAVVNDLQRLQESKGVSSMSREEWAAKLLPILDTWIQLCQPHADLLTHAHTSRKEAKPIEGFVDAEVDASLSLVGRVDQSMSDLRKVIEGQLLLSEKLKSESNAMLGGEVPLAWEGSFSGPDRIIAWMTALIHKTAAIRRWLSLSHDAALLKSKLNLADLFRPQTFLNALRQETAHLTREPLVSLKLTSRAGAPPPNCAISVCFSGLLLQGAVLEDDGKLGEIRSADASAFFPLPEVYMGWTMDIPADDASVAIPVYATSTKETLLMELRLPCASSAEVDKFVLAGVAIMLEQ